jgi:hypothetical protein
MKNISIVRHITINNYSNLGWINMDRDEFQQSWANQSMCLVEPITNTEINFGDWRRNELRFYTEEAFDLVRKFMREIELCRILVKTIPTHMAFPRTQTFVDDTFSTKYVDFIGREFISTVPVGWSGSVPPQINISIGERDDSLEPIYSLNGITGSGNLGDVIALVKRIWSILGEFYQDSSINFDDKYPWWRSKSFAQSEFFVRNQSENTIRPRPSDAWYVEMLDRHGYYESSNVFWLLRDDLIVHPLVTEQPVIEQSILLNSQPVTEQSIQLNSQLATEQSTELDSQPVTEQSIQLNSQPTEELCVICMVNKPATLVLPCAHKVACHECSDKLKDDPTNKDKCVLCRTQISFISEEPRSGQISQPMINSQRVNNHGQTYEHNFLRTYFM